MPESNLMFQNVQHNFVGRAKELALFQEEIMNEEWRLFHVYGAGGVGKTALLRLFASTMEVERSFYFDGHDGFQNTQQFMGKVLLTLQGKLQSRPLSQSDDLSAVASAPTIDQITFLLNSYATDQQGIVLFIDTFEQCGMIENWLRDSWFPQLSPQIRVCTAGRYALQGHWLLSGWNRLVYNWELQPLLAPEVREYAYQQGIKKHETIDMLQQFSQGIPLALTMACDIIRRQGKTEILEAHDQEQIVGFLVNELTKDITEPWLKQYTEAASTVWRFDQELLQALMQEDIPTDRFVQFCRLPFVIRYDRGWMLHDSIRRWSFTELRGRAPQTLHHYQARALHVLRKREAIQPELRFEFAFEKLYLHEHDFIRIFSFQWDDSFVVRPCREEDLDRIEYLYMKYLRRQPFYRPDDIHLEPLIRTLWKVEPSSFIGLWKKGSLIAFCSCVMLTERTIDIFRSNVITAPATEHFKPEKPQCIISLAGMEPLLEKEIAGSIARALAIVLYQDKFIEQGTQAINLLPVSHWQPLLSVFGYERAAWADSLSPLGAAYQAYQLDLQADDFPARVDRMFSNTEPESDTAYVQLPIESAIKLTKTVLKNYARLSLQPELARSLLPLLQEHPQSEMDIEQIAFHLKTNILNILQLFHEGSTVEQRHYNILCEAYIQQSGSHDHIARSLNLTIPTYYRHLQMAVRSLACALTHRR